MPVRAEDCRSAKDARALCDERIQHPQVRIAWRHSIHQEPARLEKARHAGWSLAVADKGLSSANTELRLVAASTAGGRERACLGRVAKSGTRAVGLD